MNLNSKYFILLATLISVCGCAAKAQLAATEEAIVKHKDIFGTRVFIENTGQYNVRLNHKILYVVDNGYEKIYFTKAGPVYEFEKPVTFSGPYAKQQQKKHKPEKYFVNMLWCGQQQSGVKIIASEKQAHYFTYGTEAENAATFQKITYKNLYPAIDVEYIIDSEKQNGIKYNLILHPGANPAHVKILYSGNVQHLQINHQGDLNIKTTSETITEHKPLSFYQDGATIKSQFHLLGDTISFRFTEHYHPDKTIVVDPWVTTTTSFTLNNSNAYDVDFDYLGNTYIYGSVNSLKVAKYSQAGNLLWTFSGNVSAANWSSQPSNYIGNFCVDKFSGKCFIGQGYNALGSQVIRLNTNGNYDNYVSAANTNYEEIWDMGFHCSNGNVFSLGGGHSSNISAATISYTNTSLNLSTFQPANTNPRQDIASHCTDDVGNIYVLYSTSANAALNDRVCRVNSTFNGNVWTTPSNFSSIGEGINKSMLSGNLLFSNGYNCLAANANYLYYYNGSQLAAYSTLTGSMIALAVIQPTVNAMKQCGIATDNCNNIYLGAQGSVLPVYFNGTSFSTLTPISLSIAATNAYVYDVKINKNTKKLFVSGHGFVALLNAPQSIDCSAQTSACQYTIPTLSVFYNTSPCSLTSATAVVNTGNGPFTYTWLPTGQTSSVASNLPAGIHTVYVTNTQNNSVSSQTIPVNQQFIMEYNVTNTNIACYGAASGSAKIANLTPNNAPYTYAWQGPSALPTGTIANNLNPGNYSVTVTNSLVGCSLTKTFSIVQPPPLTLSVFPHPLSICPNFTTFLAYECYGGTPFAISPNYLYNWINGPTSKTRVISEQTPGYYTYTMVVSDSNACSVSSQITIQVLPKPVLAVNNATICLNKPAKLKATGAQTYLWSNGSTDSLIVCAPVVTSTYMVIGTLRGCADTAVASVEVNLLPKLSVSVSPAPIVCAGQTLNIKGNGPFRYQWRTPENLLLFGETVYIPSPFPVNSGYYRFTGVDTNLCSKTDSIYIKVNPIPTAQMEEGVLSGCPPVCVNPSLKLNTLSANVVSLKWECGNEVQIGPAFSKCFGESGQYPVICNITDINGCTNAKGIVVEVWPTPLADFTYSPTNAIENLDEVLFTNSTTGLGQITYNWYFTSLITETPEITTSKATLSHYFSGSGIYPVTLLATNELGCSDTLIKPVKILEDKNIYVPNVFTPNQDGLNEIFGPVTNLNGNWQFLVFNRWGEKIFEGSKSTGGWDGNNKGKACEVGVYVWKLNLELESGENKEMLGIVTLLK